MIPALSDQVILHNCSTYLVWGPHLRRTLTTEEQRAENVNVVHSRFLSEAPAQASWGSANNLHSVTNGETDEVDSLTPGKGSHTRRLMITESYSNVTEQEGCRPLPRIYSS